MQIVNKTRFSISAFVLAFLAFGFMSFGAAKPVSAANVLATSVLGQLDSSLQPTFTQGTLNSHQINDYGFSGNSNVAIDTVNHRLFVADTNNNRVLVFDLDINNELQDYHADRVLGQTGFTSNNIVNPPSAASLSAPVALFYNNTSNTLFVADSGNSRVLVFDVATIDNGEDAIAVLGRSGFTTNNFLNPPTASSLFSPQALAYNNTSNTLFVADSGNNRVLVFDVATIDNGEAAVSVLGQTNFITRQQVAPSAISLSSSRGLAYNNASNTLFVSDFNNHRVLVFDVATIDNGEAAVSVLGQTNFTSGSVNTISASSVLSPQGLAYNSINNTLFLADGSNRILIFDVATIDNGEAAVSVLGNTNFTSHLSGAPTASNLYSARAITYNSTNNTLFVADTNNHRVLVFDVAIINNGENAVAVLGQLDSSLQPTFTQGTLNSHQINAYGFDTNSNIAIDTVNHRLFVADTNNNRVLVFDLDINNELQDYHADRVLGQTGFTTNSIGSLTASSLNRPVGLAYNNTSNTLFVADTNNNRVLVFDVATIDNGEDAIAVLGQPDFTTAIFLNPPTASSFFAPRGLAYNNTSNTLFVADTNNHRVLVFDVAIINNGEDAIAVLGQPSFDTNQAGLSDSAVSFPNSLAYNNTSNTLFVADYGNNRVLVFDASSISTGEAAVSVLGQPDFSSVSTFPITASSLSGPRGLVYNNTSNSLFVADSGNARILVFNVSAFTNNQPAVAVVGQPDFSSVLFGLPISSFSYSSPQSLAYNNLNNTLFISDNASNRILAVKLTDLAAATLANASVGTAYSQSVVATNAQGTVTYNVTSGFLPNGLALDTATGLISGTPTTAGTSIFTITVSDVFADGSVFSDSEVFTITTVGTSLMFVEFSSATATSTDESAADNFPVLLVNGVVSADSTVEVDITGGTAVNGTDFTSLDPIVVTIPAGTYDGTTTTAITIPVPTLINSSTVEGNRTINFSLTNPSSEIAVGDQSSHTYTITDDDVAVEFSSSAAASTDESAANNFPVLLVKGVITSTSTIEVDITGGTAVNGTHYTSLDPIVVTIPAGTYDGTTTTAITISVPTLINNLLVGGNKTIALELTNPSSEIAVGDANANIIIQSFHTYTITEDDVPVVPVPFIITVQTDNAGTSTSTEFTIPTIDGGYNYDVDCDNNGSNEFTGQNGNTTCSYAVPGTYQIAISGTFPRIFFNYGGDTQKLVSVNQWGTNPWTSMASAFAGASNMVILATDTPNLSSVTDMSWMFADATSFNQNISNWDISNVTNIGRMFFEATAFNQPLNWNTTNVIDMTGMFRNATAFNQNISAWDTSNVTNMSGMFLNATAFNNQNQPLNWNTANVTDMGGMFDLATAFNQNISAWDTSNVTNMSAMFSSAFAFNNQNQPLNWNTANVTNMSFMFSHATAFNQPLNWNTVSTTDMSFMFFEADAFNQNLGTWNVGNVTQMNGMLFGTGLSSSNYDQILTGWSGQTVQPLVSFSAGSTQYCNAATARDVLTSPSNSWTITDGGISPLCTPLVLELSSPVGSGAESDPGSFTVTLNHISTQDVTFQWNTDAGTAGPADYSNGSANWVTSTIPAGSISTTTLLGILDDSVDESDETIEITIGNVSANASLGSVTNQTYTIVDNDVTLTILYGTGYSNSEAVTGTITVYLSGTSTNDVTFEWSTSASTASDATTTINGVPFPADFTGGSTSWVLATIPAGSLSTTINLGIFDDNLYEGQETIRFTLGTVVGALVGAVTFQDYSITDNDRPTVQFLAGSNSGPESVSAPAFTLVLSNPSATPLNITLGIDTANSTATWGAGNDINLTSSTVSISAAQTSTPVVSSLAVADDSAVEPEETATIFIQSAGTATIGLTSTFTYTILNNDAAPAPVSGGGGGSAMPISTAGNQPVTVVVLNPVSSTNPAQVLGVRITKAEELLAAVKPGQTSDKVRELQLELQSLGFFAKGIRPTRFYGPVTRAAVEKYLASKAQSMSLDELVSTLKTGSRGNAVRKLQTELKKLGFFPNVAVTTYFGPVTRAAVAKYLASR